MPVIREQEKPNVIDDRLGDMLKKFDPSLVRNRGKRDTLRLRNPWPDEYEVGWIEIGSEDRIYERGGELIPAEDKTGNSNVEALGLGKRVNPHDTNKWIIKGNLVAWRLPKRIYEAELIVDVIETYDNLGWSLGSLNKDAQGYNAQDHDGSVTPGLLAESKFQNVSLLSPNVINAQTKKEATREKQVKRQRADDALQNSIASVLEKRNISRDELDSDPDGNED